MMLLPLLLAPASCFCRCCHYQCSWPSTQEQVCLGVELSLQKCAQLWRVDAHHEVCLLQQEAVLVQLRWRLGSGGGGRDRRGPLSCRSRRGVAATAAAVLFSFCRGLGLLLSKDATPV